MNLSNREIKFLIWALEGNESFRNYYECSDTIRRKVTTRTDRLRNKLFAILKEQTTPQDTENEEV